LADVSQSSTRIPSRYSMSQDANIGFKVGIIVYNMSRYCFVLSIHEAGYSSTSNPETFKKEIISSMEELKKFTREDKLHYIMSQRYEERLSQEDIDEIWTEICSDKNYEQTFLEYLDRNLSRRFSSLCSGSLSRYAAQKVGAKYQSILQGYWKQVYGR